MAKRTRIKKGEKWVPKRKGVKVIRQRPLAFTVSSKTLAGAKSWSPRAFVKKKKKN